MCRKLRTAHGVCLLPFVQVISARSLNVLPVLDASCLPPPQSHFCRISLLFRVKTSRYTSPPWTISSCRPPCSNSSLRTVGTGAGGSLTPCFRSGLSFGSRPVMLAPLPSGGVKERTFRQTSNVPRPAPRHFLINDTEIQSQSLILAKEVPSVKAWSANRSVF